MDIINKCDLSRRFASSTRLDWPMSQISKLGHKDLIRYFWAVDLIRLMSTYKIDPLNTL